MIRLWIFIALLSSLLYSATVTETEPNNQATQANPITLIPVWQNALRILIIL